MAERKRNSGNKILGKKGEKFWAEDFDLSEKRIAAVSAILFLRPMKQDLIIMERI